MDQQTYPTNIQFMAIPKNASLSVEGFCKHNNIPVIHHVRNFNHIKNKIYNHDLLFCIIRNPVDRFISTYSFLKKGGVCNPDKKEWAEFCSPYENVDEFVEKGLYVAEKKQIHFRSQYKWLENEKDEILYDKINFLKFKNLRDELKIFSEKHNLKYFEISHGHKSDRNGLVLSERSVEIIKDVYKNDYNLINQVFENNY